MTSNPKRISNIPVRFVLIAALVVVFGAFFVRQFSHQPAAAESPLADPTYGFQYYAPHQLPTGIAIKDKRIAVMREGNKTYGITADLTFRTEDWVYSIMERRHTDEQTTTVLTNYDPKSTEVTCQQQASPKGQEYRLCHWTDYGRISVFEIKFVKGDTLIGTTFPTATDKIIPTSEISDYVDSFEKDTTDGWLVSVGI